MDSIIPVDLNLFPATFDMLHVGLAGMLALLLLINLVLLIALIKRKRVSAGPAQRQSVLQPVVMKEASPDAALQLLGLLQSEARFIDFIEENIASYADADVGAAVRVVHEGCRKVFKGHFVLEAIRHEAEGERITLPKGFDAAAVRLTGSIVGEAPFNGVLVHRGWRVASVTLPKVAEGHDLKIITPAEVEL